MEMIFFNVTQLLLLAFYITVCCFNIHTMFLKMLLAFRNIPLFLLPRNFFFRTFHNTTTFFYLSSFFFTLIIVCIYVWGYIYKVQPSVYPDRRLFLCVFSSSSSSFVLFVVDYRVTHFHVVFFFKSRYFCH